MVKRILLISVVLTLAAWVIPVYASFNLVNSCYSSASGFITTSTCTLGTVNAGDAIVIAQRINTSGVTSVVSDSGGDVFTTSTVMFGSSGRYIVWWAGNTSGGSGFVVSTTYSGGGTNFSSMVALEYSGVSLYNPFDAATSTFYSSSAPSGTVSSGTSTTMRAGDLNLGFGYGGTLTPGTGFVFVTTSTESGTTGIPGSYSASWSNSVASATVAIEQLLLRPQQAIPPTSDVTVWDGVTITDGVTIR